jgi:hypothetical protein
MRRRAALCGWASVLLTVVMNAGLFAKRVTPSPVPSVVVAGIEYRVTHFPVERMGFVEAYDLKTKSLIWTRQIYVVIKDPLLEGDVQDVFIKTLTQDGDALIVTNEIGFIYRLDLKSLNVTVIKGAVRVGR